MLESISTGALKYELIPIEVDQQLKYTVATYAMSKEAGWNFEAQLMEPCTLREAYEFSCELLRNKK